MKADAFPSYVTRFLAPEQGRGGVGIMHNLSAYNTSAICVAIEGIGVTLLFLPPSGPDFKPIE